MQLLVKGTRRIIFILCAVSDAKRLSISKHPANAHKINIIRRWDSQWGSGSKVVEGGVYCQISLMW